MKAFFCCCLLLLSGLNAVAQIWSIKLTEGQCSPRHENSVTAIGEKLVLIGGRDMRPVDVYDLKTNRWTRLSETPLEISHFQAITYRGEAWVVGAFTGSYPNEVPVPDIYIFNVEKNEWRKGPSIPEGRRRGAAGAFVYNNKIYLVCGEQDGHWDGTVAWFDEYDPERGTWKKLPDAPTARDHVSVAVAGGRLYVAGGRRSSAKTGQVLNTTIATVDVFDFNTLKWTTLPSSQNLPTPRAGASAVAWQDRILIMGGESDRQVAAHNETEAFNTTSGQWEKLPALRQGRHGTGAVNIGGKVFIVAGSANRGGGPEMTTLEILK